MDDASTYLLQANLDDAWSESDVASAIEELDGVELIGTGPQLRFVVPGSAVVELLNGLPFSSVELSVLDLTQVDPDRPPDPFHLPDETSTELLVRQANIDLALEAGGLGLWTWDMNADVVSWSQQVEEFHGFEPGTFPGTFAAFSETIHRDDRDTVLAGVAEAAATGADLHNEYRFMRCDGSIGWLRGAARIVKDARDESVALVGVAIDQTELVMQREDLRRQRDQLTATAKERATLTKMLQQTLQPSTLPQPKGLLVDAAYTGAEAESTGDFYDLFPTSTPGEWMLVIGDIAGHGPEAAVLTGSVRRSIHSAALLASDPGVVLSAANGVHLATSTDYRFATTHAILFRTHLNHTAELLLATAGHPPVLVVRNDGQVEWHRGTGPPLGIVADAEYIPGKTRLGRGDSVIVYTDGITEAGAGRGGGEGFGPDRLASFATKAIDEATDGMSGVASVLLDEARHFAGNKLRDDAACVVIQVD